MERVCFHATAVIQQVGAIATFGIITAPSEVDEIVTASAVDYVISQLTADCIATITAEDRIIAIVAKDIIVALLSFQMIVTATTIQRVAFSPAYKPVITTLPFKDIVAGTPEESIVACAAIDQIATGFAIEDIIALRAKFSLHSELVIIDRHIKRANDRVVSVTGFDIGFCLVVDPTKLSFLTPPLQRAQMAFQRLIIESYAGIRIEGVRTQKPLYNSI
jgi:hypothetical protein